MSKFWSKKDLKLFKQKYKNKKNKFMMITKIKTFLFPHQHMKNKLPAQLLQQFPN